MNDQNNARTVEQDALGKGKELCLSINERENAVVSAIDELTFTTGNFRSRFNADKRLEPRTRKAPESARGALQCLLTRHDPLTPVPHPTGAPERRA